MECQMNTFFATVALTARYSAWLRTCNLVRKASGVRLLIDTVAQRLRYAHAAGIVS